MNKSVLVFLSILALAIPVLAGDCGFHNLVGEWTSTTKLASTPDAKCGDVIKTEKTVFVFMNKGGGKVSGNGSRVSTKNYHNQNCSPKMTTFRYPSIELISNGDLSIVSENGAQAISTCNVNSDRSQLKIGSEVYQRTK